MNFVQYLKIWNDTARAFGRTSSDYLADWSRAFLKNDPRAAIEQCPNTNMVAALMKFASSAANAAEELGLTELSIEADQVEVACSEKLGLIDRPVVKADQTPNLD